MNRLIKTLSIISVVIAGIGFLLALSLLTFLWEPANLLMGGETIAQAKPVVPKGHMFYIVGYTIVSIILCASYKSKRLIVIETLSIALLVLIIPMLMTFFEFLQKSALPFWPFEYLQILVSAETLMIFPIAVVKLSSCLCLITSGIRIAQKSFLKKQ